MRQRRFIHPHDSRYMVIDVLDEKGQMIRTYNIERMPCPYHYVVMCGPDCAH